MILIVEDRRVNAGMDQCGKVLSVGRIVHLWSSEPKEIGSKVDSSDVDILNCDLMSEKPVIWKMYDKSQGTPIKIIIEDLKE